jgi:hypothetical protein
VVVPSSSERAPTEIGGSSFCSGDCLYSFLFSQVRYCLQQPASPAAAASACLASPTVSGPRDGPRVQCRCPSLPTPSMLLKGKPIRGLRGGCVGRAELPACPPHFTRARRQRPGPASNRPPPRPDLRFRTRPQDLLSRLRPDTSLHFFRRHDALPVAPRAGERAPLPRCWPLRLISSACILLAQTKLPRAHIASDPHPPALGQALFAGGDITN